jgi:hypothetical protein
MLPMLRGDETSGFIPSFPLQMKKEITPPGVDRILFDNLS